MINTFHDLTCFLREDSVMITRFRIIILTALIICLILSFISCDSKDDSNLTEEETTVDMTLSNAQYPRRYFERATTDAAINLRKHLEAAESKLKSKQTGKRGEKIVRFPNEILIAEPIARNPKKHI